MERTVALTLPDGIVEAGTAGRGLHLGADEAYELSRDEAIREGDTLALTAELVNVAAVAVAWLERLELEGRQPPLRLTSIVRSVKGLSR